MIAGRLDRRIVIQSKSVARNAYNETINTWSTFLTVWSNPVQMDGKEQTTEDNRTTDRMVTFRVRYNGTITSAMRIIWESNYYKIEDIKEVGRQDGLLIRTSMLSQT